MIQVIVLEIHFLRVIVCYFLLNLEFFCTHVFLKKLKLHYFI